MCLVNKFFERTSVELKNLSDKDLIKLYPALLKELRVRGIAKTKNVVGELGEYITKRIYSETPNFPKLQDAPASTKNIDAISVRGERYAIKASSGSNTGVFASLPLEDDGKVYFEYLVVVLFDKDYQLKMILEADWGVFLKYRRIKKPEGKWYVPINQDLIKSCKSIPFNSLNL